MEILPITNSDEEIFRDQLSYGDEVLNYEKSSRDGASSVYWWTSMGPQNFFEQITEDFDSEDYGMAILADNYGKTLDEEHQGPVETTVGELTDIEDFYDRAGFIVVGNEEYEATWEDTSGYTDVDTELCFLLKTEESVDNSLLEDFMNRTLGESDKFYDDVRELHTTDFKDLKAKVN